MSEAGKQTRHLQMALMLAAMAFEMPLSKRGGGWSKDPIPVTRRRRIVRPDPWAGLNGENAPSVRGVARNAPCPCGCGRKAKRCLGKAH